MDAAIRNGTQVPSGALGKASHPTVIRALISHRLITSFLISPLVSTGTVQSTNSLLSPEERDLGSNNIWFLSLHNFFLVSLTSYSLPPNVLNMCVSQGSLYTILLVFRGTHLLQDFKRPLDFQQLPMY